MHLLNDFGCALRTMRRQPAPAVLAIVVLGIGIGAATVAFSAVDAVLLRPLPYDDPDRLVFVWNRLAATNVEKSALSGPALSDLKERTTAFEDLVGFFINTTSLVEKGRKPTALNVGWTQSSFFTLLGGEMALGEMFRPEHEGLFGLRPTDADAGSDAELPAVPLILSYEYWQRSYGGDPQVLGRSVVVDGHPMYVYGVAPEDFRLFLPVDAPYSGDVEAWAPLPSGVWEEERMAQFFCVAGRLKPGVTLTEAQSEADAVAAWQRESFDFHRTAGVENVVVPIHRDVTLHVRPYFLLALGAAGLVLLLTGFNVAHLFLLRAVARRQEIRVRASLGGRSRSLALQGILENVWLVLPGCALGVLLAHWGTGWLLSFQTPELPRFDQIGLSLPVLAVSLGTALLALLVFCAFTARHRFRRLLVQGEIALSVTVLVAAGLLWRSALELSRVDPGFRAENVLTARLVLPSHYEPPSRILFFDEVVRRAAALPGVESASGAHPLPLSEEGPGWFGPWSIDGMDPDAWEQNEADYRQTMPGYFETMGIPLIAGRTLTPADNQEGSEPVVVVDEVFARRAWPGEDAVGKRLLTFHFTMDAQFTRSWMKVVGVVAHVRDDLTRDGRGTVYPPLRFYGYRRFDLTLRAAGDLTSLAEPLQQEILAMDPDLPLMKVRPMLDYVHETQALDRLALAVIGLFGVIAGILAAVGLYSETSAAVADRCREIGTRIAHGAGPGTISRRVFRQALVLNLGGIAAGLAAAVLTSRALADQLYGVTPTDPLTLAAAAALQGVIALLAIASPAWRASRIVPVSPLRTP